MFPLKWVVIELLSITGCWNMDVFSFWEILGVKNGRSNLKNNQNYARCFFPTGNDISQPFKVSVKEVKKKGPIVHTLVTVHLKFTNALIPRTQSIFICFMSRIFKYVHQICQFLLRSLTVMLHWTLTKGSDLMVNREYGRHTGVFLHLQSVVRH